MRDCCWAYEALDRLNEARWLGGALLRGLSLSATQEVLQPTLGRLTQQPFFRYFKVNLYCDCPFWPDDSMCALPDCSVCECPADEVPLPWRTPAPVETAPEGSGAEACEEAGATSAREGVVDRTLDAAGAGARAWRVAAEPWTVEDERAGSVYVNLALNPERFTGYAGEHAHRVWRAIYSQPCFAGADGPEGLCSAGPHARTFYRLISGLHASITTHIAAEHLLDAPRGVWGPHPGLWQARLGSRADWQANLYFTATVVLRAVQRAGPVLLAADYRTGSPAADAATLAAMQELFAAPAIAAACPPPFDESRLWGGADGPARREELRQHFRNVSAVMDCVGCEKCRLWGKLQMLGLGTALKILSQPPGLLPELQRNEVIALLNLLHRLSDSLAANARLRAMVAAGDGPAAPPTPQHRPGLPAFLT